MDTDAFIAVHRPQWDRLRDLTRSRRLDAAGIDELLALYQETSTHLSTLRSTNPDPALISRLSLLVHRARLRITGARIPLWKHARTFFWEDLPAALYQARWTVALAAGLFLVSAVVTGLYFGLDPSARAMVIPEAQQRMLVQRDFVSYYFQGEASGFAAQVWTNNAWITVQAVVFGVTGIWPVVMLVQNGLNVGLSAGVMGAHGGLGTFFTYILPHGLLEITAVVVGAGAGLRTFWAWVRPGPLPRLWALSRAARALVTVAIGLVPVLLISGFVEAFVTPSSLPAPLRIAIGAAVWLAFLVYMLGRGRQAHRAGISGDLSEELVGARVATAG
ncbi:stage II sporulation protein M [Brachybacterium saurashtrense]|uniref:Stage II sporulation protein M n=1 Tax=Brachybacterium saurashtrense TaxID=556288 RepID=A0A345YNM5_9MICO|nr:stage II sporulation protein M [Brachybacterium saurashtrense]AXK45527.1 stage II sporulation protein M [Brachybacterium saurashtrense]RRR21102.1 stage II sporulation protein M [Brachybacterium saurashtrense]